jgi:hypothetical protein
MISTERLEEMRQAELRVVQYPHQHQKVKRVSAELADALGELIERRVDPENPVWRGQQGEAAAAVTRSFTVESEGTIAKSDNQIELWGERGQ